MPRRYYFCTVIVLFLQCATIFDRRSDFEKAIVHYHDANIERAIHYFEKYLVKHPESDTALYYLYDCYRQQGDHRAQIDILETFVQRTSTDVHVYTVLLNHYYTKGNYDRFFRLYGSTPEPVKPIIDARYGLTRGLYARLCIGATHTTAIANEPMHHALARGYLPFTPDGMSHEQDTMTFGNLIIALDHLLEPTYPEHFYPLKHISERSFLYLPYMRLVNTGILAYQSAIDPNMIVPVSMAVQAIQNMCDRGYID